MIRTKRQWILCFAWFCTLPICIHAQTISIIPAPVSLKQEIGHFLLTNSTTISIPAKQPELASIAKYFADKVKPATGYTLNTVEAKPANIVLTLNTKPNSRLGQEGYTLHTEAGKVDITANTATGIFYGVQTLLQLLPAEILSASLIQDVEWKAPSVTILDYPRFTWRGQMFDVSRHFFSKEYVKKYIDRMASYKLNRFHWHLTDDNGWRIEIKSLPRLTSVGAWRVPRVGTFGSNDAPKPGEPATYGGYYKQADIKEIVQYAKERYIEVLPEIDVPGHSMAVLASYPELSVTNDTTLKVNPGSSFSTWFGNGKFEMHLDNTLDPTDEKVYQFLDKVFTEVAVLFPFEYIHMGGDECYKGFWERDKNVQAFMKKNNLKNGEELQSYFVKRVGKIIQSKKKKMMGWDEILEGGIAPGAAVMSWRGTKGGIEASHLKHPVVMSPAPVYYLDMYQGERSIEPPVYNSARLKEVYTFDLVPAEMDSAYVLGAQGNLWTEQIPTEPQVEYMTYPRALAMAESFWTPEKQKDWNSFVPRVEYHFKRMDIAQINYAQSIYDAIVTVRKNASGKLIIELATEVPGLDIYYTVDNSIPNQYYPKYNSPIEYPAGADNLRVITFRKGEPVGRLISLKTEELEKRVKK
ncbi:beta-N-acetylhexosaminidase [Ohtaekwangia koreensis]|uniref:beta-N-acetylhexosaminidase n=1 Tax=Ohtaekwangia koreensis TaxID=688867 RepID=A0A1T5LCP8_9BACT|nr:family 20 glycosylhydrolase [Ohtaekwangia koreensis]SKC73664.1 hexosaminidase [Ohtaekwangia koreensis]